MCVEHLTALDAFALGHSRAHASRALAHTARANDLMSAADAEQITCIALSYGPVVLNEDLHVACPIEHLFILPVGRCWILAQCQLHSTRE